MIRAPRRSLRNDRRRSCDRRLRESGERIRRLQTSSFEPPSLRELNVEASPRELAQAVTRPAAPPHGVSQGSLPALLAPPLLRKAPWKGMARAWQRSAGLRCFR